jgi:hypothetical protein
MIDRDDFTLQILLLLVRWLLAREARRPRGPRRPAAARGGQHRRSR